MKANSLDPGDSLEALELAKGLARVEGVVDPELGVGGRDASFKGSKRESGSSTSLVSTTDDLQTNFNRAPEQTELSAQGW